MSQVNNHPVHILDSDGKMSPSSFIPFCFYGKNRLKTTQNVDQFRQTVCSSFQGRVFKDQLCYEFNLTQVLEGETSSANMHIGLGFLYDNNVERFIHTQEDAEEKIRSELGFLNNFVTLEETEKTLVYLSSLGNRH